MASKTKYVKQTVARDLKTGRFVKMAVAKRRPTTTAVTTVRIPQRQRSA